jgi:hypothetical protein
VTQALQQSERQFERAVVEYAELNHWLVYHTFDSRRSNAGFPDLVLVRHDRLIFAELKSEKGRLSPAQVEWLRALHTVELAALTCRVVEWRPSMWGEIEGVLR